MNHVRRAGLSHPPTPESRRLHGLFPFLLSKKEKENLNILFFSVSPRFSSSGMISLHTRFPINPVSRDGWREETYSSARQWASYLMAPFPMVISSPLSSMPREA
jgi:hypothetical protein